MSWWDIKEQRRKNRTTKGREAEHARARRRHGWTAILEKKSGEVICEAHNGCFGKLAQFAPEQYQEWAYGTRGGNVLTP